MKKLILLFSLVLMLSSISAISDLGTFKQGSIIELRQTCDNCTFVNLTSVSYPNSTLGKYDVVMTKQGVDYNYTFSTTSLVGDHLYNVCGDKNGILVCETISFNITPSGSEDNTGFYILIILLVYAIAFIGFFGKSEWIAMFGGLAMMFLGVYIVNYGIIIYRDVFTVALSYFTIGLGAFFSLFTGLEIIKNNYD